MVVIFITNCTQNNSFGTPIRYHITGGMLGLDDTLIINQDRQVTIIRFDNSSKFTIEKDVYTQLLKQFDQAKFLELNRTYLPDDSCCDLIEYEITYKGHTVRTMDTAIPTELEPILDTLNEILANH
jgi:hypothetical protein